MQALDTYKGSFQRTASRAMTYKMCGDRKWSWWAPSTPDKIHKQPEHRTVTGL